MKWMTGIRLAVEAQKERIEDGNEIFNQLERAKEAQDFGMGMSQLGGAQSDQPWNEIPLTLKYKNIY